MKLNKLLTHKLEIEVFILGLISTLLWFSKGLHWIFCIIVYFFIFGYLFYKKRPIHHYLIVCIFSMFARNNEHYPNYDYILTGILFFYVLTQSIINRSITLGKLLMVLIINTTYAIISLSYTPDVLFGLQGIGSFMQGYMAYFIITNSEVKFNKDTLIQISKLASLFLIFISIEIFNQYLIHDFSNISNLKEIINLGWQYGNLIAPFYVMFIPVALYKYTIKEEFYLSYFIIDLLNIAGIFLTLSRGGYLGLAVALLIFSILNIKNFKMIYRYGSIALGILVLAYFIPFVNKIVNVLFAKLGERNFFDDNARYPMWEVAFNAFLERPIFGYGINSTNYLLLRDIGRDAKFFHNLVLNVAAPLGIIGLIILGLLFIRILLILFKPQSTFIMCVAAGIFGSLVHEFVDIMFDYLMYGLVFYTLLGLVELYRNHDINDKFKLKVKEW